MFFGLMMFTLILSGGMDLRILEPHDGDFLSGNIRILLQCDQPQRVSSMLLTGNDEILYEGSGWKNELTVDFGERIRGWTLVLTIKDEYGNTFSSPVVRTKALRIDFEETARLILVPVMVKNRRGRNVQNLKLKHFEVRQDGEKCGIRLIQQKKVPLRIVLLVDSSSSLRREIDVLKNAVLEFVGQLEEGDTTALITFNDTARMVYGFHASREEIDRGILNLKPGGGTALFDGILLAEDKLKDLPRLRKTIVLFTDGKDTVYEEVSEKRMMLKKVVERAQKNEITVFTIGTGEHIHRDALGFIATETGGEFVHAQGMGDLKSRFRDVLNDLKNQYVLHMDPVFTTPGNHRVEVIVHKRGVRVFARRGYHID